LKILAQALRYNQTDTEQRLWLYLRSRQLSGHKFRRQHVIGSYIVDFCCLDRKLIIELDGGQHASQAEADKQRTKFLESEGFRLVRFWDNEVFQNIDGVLEKILELLDHPHPALSPPGRGKEKGASLSSGKIKIPVSRLAGKKGQAMTEMVLLVPLFLIFALGIIKIFALSIMVQKLELASYYAGRRWMLESHKNATWTPWDQDTLRKDIEKWVADYLIGTGDDFKEKFLGVKREDIHFKVNQTILYAVLTLKVKSKGLIPFRPEMEKEWEVIKYVPTRDRPIKWNIPSLASEEQGQGVATQ